MTTEEKQDCVRLALGNYGTGYSYDWEIYDRPGGKQLGRGWKGSELATYTAKGNYNVVYVRPAVKPDAAPDRITFWTRKLTEHETAISHTIRTLRAEGKDPHQYQTYAFERALYDWGQEGSNIVHNEAYAQVVIESACKWARVPPPDLIKISSRIKNAGFYTYTSEPEPEQRIIIRPRKELQTWLHETAHYILDAQGLECTHTAKFRKLILDLYHHFDDSFVGSPLGAVEIAKVIGVDIDWTYSARKYKPEDPITTYNGSYAL